MNKHKHFFLLVLLFLGFLPVRAQFVQQGSKLVGTGAVGTARQGYSVSISADGNTAIVGGYVDNSNVGAAWVYIRSGGVWTQQGSKLVGTGAVGDAYQGYSVSISADGNTAIVGGYADNGSAGAAWVYTRSGGMWTQQGNKLVGTGAAGRAEQGYSVSISADGNTAIVGGRTDNNTNGAVWIYTRSGGLWIQQGSKLVGTGASGIPSQGTSVAVSSDGNTVIVGGPGDLDNTGAAWVFTRNDSVWTQQGSKLVGTDAVWPVWQGYSVSISGDANTAIVGGWSDNNNTGAAWVYTRSDTVWTQQGSKLVDTATVGIYQGVSVATSADGNTAIIGGLGAAWVYTRSGSVWTQQGNKLVGTGDVGGAQQGSSVAISGDGNTAISGDWQDDSTKGAAWIFTNSNVQGVRELADAQFSYHLLENYPNPFNPTTQISYTLARASNVTLTVYNVLGQQIVTLVNAKNEPGEHSVNWNALNVPSGVYFYRIVAGDFVQVKKMMLMK